jgi:hypothetical protein
LVRGNVPRPAAEIKRISRGDPDAKIQGDIMQEVLNPVMIQDPFDKLSPVA